MTLVLGAALAAGLLLVASPWLWRSGATGGAKHPPLASRLARLLADAGLARVRPRVIVAASVLVAVLAGAIAWLVIAVPAIAALAAVAAGSAPTFWLLRRRAALVRSRRALWPDVIDHLIASVRAGMSLPDAVSSLALTAPAVLRPAFAAFERDFAGVPRPWAEPPPEGSGWEAELLALPVNAPIRGWNSAQPGGRRWVLYRTGTAWVDRAMAESGRTSADLVSAPTAEILSLAGVAR